MSVDYRIQATGDISPLLFVVLLSQSSWGTGSFWEFWAFSQYEGASFGVEQFLWCLSLILFLPK